MAPTRKRGGGAKDKTKFCLDDLVLAKVKGFPAWPAKISNPEDWQRGPDPKKYFVQFFGTEEIAFVAPADIQAFTIEAKNKLSARNKVKVRYFAQALEEICEEFEQLQQKKLSDIRDDSRKSECEGASTSAAVMIDAAAKTDPLELTGDSDLNRTAEYGSLGERVPGLERCSMRLGEMESQDVKPCTADDANGVSSSPTTTSKRGSRNPAKVSIFDKELVSAIIPNHQSKRDSSCHGGVEDGCSRKISCVGDSNEEPVCQSHFSGEGNPNGNKPRLSTKPKRKPEDSYEVQSISGQPSRSFRHLKDDVPKDVSYTKEPSKNSLQSALDTGNQKGTPKLLKDKKNSQASNKPLMDVKEDLMEDKLGYSQTKIGHRKQNSQNFELSNPAKSSKHIEMALDTTKRSFLSSMEIDAKRNDGNDKCSVAREKAESSCKMRAPSTVGDMDPDDEDVLPPAKRRRRALEAMSGTSTLASENRYGTSVARKSNIRRRAVRLYDDDEEEEEPKTPIHEGSAKQVVAIHEGSTKKVVASNEGSAKNVVASNEGTAKKVVTIHEGSAKKVVAIHEGSAKKVVAVHEGSAKKVVAVHEGSAKKVVAVHEGSAKKVVVVHEGSARKPVLPLHRQTSVKRADDHCSHNQLDIRDSGKFDEEKLKICEQPVQSNLPTYHQAEEQHPVEATAYHVSFNAKSADSEKMAYIDIKPVPASSYKQRAHLYDDNEEEEPKTPIHEGSAKKVLVIHEGSAKKVAPLHGQTSMKQADDHCSHNQQDIRDSGSFDEGKLKISLNGQQALQSNLPTYQQVEEQHPVEATAVSFNAKSTESEKLASEDIKPVPVSPKSLSPPKIGASKSVAEIRKDTKHVSQISGNISQRKVLSASKGVEPISGSLNSHVSHLENSSKGKAEVTLEPKKQYPNLNSKANDPALLHGTESVDLKLERPGGRRAENLVSDFDEKVSDSSMSMRHLIAAAREKKRQADVGNLHANPNSHLDSNTEIESWSPSPGFISLAIPSGNVPVLDVQGFVPNSSMTSPLPGVHQALSISRHDSDEHEERRVSSGHHDADGSLSGGIEAAVARDAFEGMIETLSRTKESIGRATRLAIDCAKHGIANEVVELLVRKLENESSFHRKVDLFFLVDSVTQCSHKGVSGASYIPAVQAALTRLIRAAAPPGSGARENRRQCLKVLRLWLDRKILPESLLRRHMDEITVVKEDVAYEFSFRRPSQAERSIDDPIREMEGMMVDEYGSNATFQLSGLLSFQLFHEEDEMEDDFPRLPIKEAVEKSPSDSTHMVADPENHPFTPNERHHHILEDVDGELEMEDVSGHQRDEGPFSIGDVEKSCSTGILGSSEISSDMPPLPDGSPPLPLCSPPATPPFPASPPPLLPSYPPPAPPPPPSLPPPPLLQPLPIPPPPIGTGTHPGPTLPHSSILTQQIHVITPSLATSTILPRPTLQPHDISLNPAGNNTYAPHTDLSTRHEVLPQRSPYFVQVGASSSEEPYGYKSRPLEYTHNSAYVNAHTAKLNQPFVPVNVPFSQRPLPPKPSQNATSHFSYSNPTVRQQLPLPVQHYPLCPPFPSMCSQPNLADGSRQFVPEERWRIRPNEPSNDYQQGMWVASSRPSSGPTYMQDGPGAPPHIVSGRPDLSAIGWRPS